ncbi:MULTISPECIES: sulfur carrier protein ThiS [Pseudobutyrivibrio]|uniref:Sulfur carrier protein n=1 Tax=Pseudobutyrivibrio ruminis DSM 9787 TaxID=1123011 RepID=A0A285SJV4_9FIRM|nr:MULTISPECIES: sulfur carrier protein ThiS [Pseudobutyrivibrio]MBE5913220.1 sulfur carrier protein ThiS [Pseudobutyrivibrio ruminis]SET04905.1 sulfur carrier protein [Pseudobutyrivibrio sp. C4]SFO27673.1 sulfur carrier protein [Pseudobutyrivibrio sp. JW11]SOC06248.1 sulfur carrier protein [Pseudobutyrivibrio ruminis DSM 9787]
MVFLNGKEYELANKTLATVLDDFKFDVRTIAVEINEEIISKTTFNETILKDGDVVEVVSFVGGG